MCYSDINIVLLEKLEDKDVIQMSRYSHACALKKGVLVK